MGYHTLTTTTPPSKSTFHPQGSKVPLGCLPVRSVSPGGTGPKTPSSGTLQYVEQTMCRACVRLLGNSGKY